MSEDFDDFAPEELDELEQYEDDQDDYEDLDEVIDPEQVNAVITAIHDLMATVSSETIRAYLESTCEDLAWLVDEDDEEFRAAA